MKLVQKYCDLPILPLPMIHRLSCSDNFLTQGRNHRISLVRQSLHVPIWGN
jgi:hypothetical protein